MKLTFFFGKEPEAIFLYCLLTVLCQHPQTNEQNTYSLLLFKVSAILDAQIGCAEGNFSD